jgi:5-methylcytosine-specific restriction endonuclease McrA
MESDLRELELPSAEPHLSVIAFLGPSFVPTPDHIQELDRLGDQIAELAAHVDAATFRLLRLIGEFDAREGWSGARSCADWLCWRIGLSKNTARHYVRVARALAPLPRITGAFARGEISYSKVRAITRVATPETEERLLGVARSGTAEHVERIVRAWRGMHRKAEAAQAARHDKSRSLTVHYDEDGMLVLHGRLAPEVGAVVLRALDAAREALYQKSRAEVRANDPAQDPPSREQQQADALALLAETALHQGLDPGTPGERYQVVVHVDAAVLADADQPGQAALEDGVSVPAGTVERLACDASRVVMRHDENGDLVEIGARTRTIPPSLRRALQHRDHGCRFPGCGLRFGQGHHIRHWAAGGPTTLSNLALLCRRHHRSVHEDGDTVERRPDGALEFRRPDGRVLPDVPPAPAVPADPVAALREAHAAYGIHARTATPDWDGRGINVGWVIDVLHPLANPLTEREAREPKGRPVAACETAGTLSISGGVQR